MPETVMIREVAVSYRGTERAMAAEPIRDPEGVAEFVRALVGGDAREHFVAIYLDGRHRPCAYQVVSIGTANASLVHPREVFQPAVIVGALGLVIAHTHPTGDPAPSPEDWTITERLYAAGKVLGIDLLDHVVVGEHEYVSLREESGAQFSRP